MTHQLLLRAFIIVAVAVGALAIACSGDSDDGPSGSQQRIVFISDRDGNAEVYVMNSNGSDVLRLTETPAEELSPVWSPLGDTIAFIRIDGESTAFFAIDADGTNERLLAETDVLYSRLSDAAWSPDGSQLVLQLAQDGNTNLFVVSSDGSGQEVLSENAELFVASWAPDGERILIQAGLAPAPRLFSVRPDGTDQLELTEDARFASWSPDASQIAFVSERDGNSEVYVMNADGTGLVNVSQSDGPDGGSFGPVWSPDGSQLAFASFRDGRAQILAVNPDGSGLITVASPSGSTVSRVDQIVWSPDGSRIAFAAAIGELNQDSDVLVVNADGTGVRNLTDSPSLGETLAGWSSDSSRIFLVGDDATSGAKAISSITVDGSDLTSLSGAEGNGSQAAVSVTD
ncbi:MAG: PD40 domain-containing protein [Chloroflexi bacterium]|nr:PD40 domain-containing protein [Chloroflexota bacterium]MCI0856277.1 PD40 domain-containing protein [Chloroflexota bacterium]